MNEIITLSTYVTIILSTVFTLFINFHRHYLYSLCISQLQCRMGSSKHLSLRTEELPYLMRKTRKQQKPPQSDCTHCALLGHSSLLLQCCSATCYRQSYGNSARLSTTTFACGQLSTHPGVTPLNKAPDE